MTSLAIIAHFLYFLQHLLARWGRHQVTHRPNLHQLGQYPHQLPQFVQESTVAMRYLELLAPLDWDHFPERNLAEKRGTRPVPYAP